MRGSSDSYDISSNLDITSPGITKRAAHPVVDLCAGTLGSMLGLFVGSPFDVVKVRMQTTGGKVIYEVLCPTILYEENAQSRNNY